MNLPVEKIQNGLVSLRESSLVEPMGLSLSVHGWQWFKYKARPGHPKPGNAGRGWTHPANLDVLAKASMRPNERNEIPIPSNCRATDAEMMEQFIRPLCRGLGFVDWQWVAEFSRYNDGTVNEVVILRGGAHCHAEYPSTAEDCPQVPAGDGSGHLEFRPTDGEKSRVAFLRMQERLSTDRFMQRIGVSVA